MRLVANITVRDEVDFIEKTIDYHLGLGFYGIVVLDICSIDGTREKLKKYNNDIRVHITETNTQGKEEIADWGQFMLEISREFFRPDFIARFDADEFLYAPKGYIDFDSLEFECDLLTLRRFNCVDVLAKDFVLPAFMSDLDERLVISKPGKTAFQQKDDYSCVPWLFSHVAPKTLVQINKIRRFTDGAHSALDADNKELSGTVSREIAVIHFPITHYQRFLRKLLNINNFYELLCEMTSENSAYHWKRWVQIYREYGEAGVLEEYKDQLEYQRYQDLVARVSQARFCLD